MSVLVDGRCPIRCAARVIDRPVLVLRSLRGGARRVEGEGEGEGGAGGGWCSLFSHANDADAASSTAAKDAGGAAAAGADGDAHPLPLHPAAASALLGVSSAAAAALSCLWGDTEECASCLSFSPQAVGDPSAPCALLKAVLLVMGVVPTTPVLREVSGTTPVLLPTRADATTNTNTTNTTTTTNTDATTGTNTDNNTEPAHSLSLSEHLAARLGVGKGLEIACLSDLPAGSGMGGSSILAAAVLQAVALVWGIGRLSDEAVVYLVLQVGR